MKARIIDEQVRFKVVRRPYETLSDELKRRLDNVEKGIGVLGPYDSLEDALIANGRGHLVTGRK